MSRFLDSVRFRRDHRWAPDHMSDYLDGELEPSARNRMHRHIGECEQCRRLLAGLRVVLEGLHRLPAPSGGAGATAIAASVRLRLNDPPTN
jgi:anti-sigma factor RsiW